MKTTFAILAVTAIGLMITAPRSHSQESAVAGDVSVGKRSKSLATGVARLAQPYIDSDNVVGMSIGVIRGPEFATVHVGSASTSGKPGNDDTIYEIGSVSKVFTGILLADAINQGKARLDQPAQDLLPDGVKMPEWEGKSITLKDMSTHRSGLPRLSNNMPSLRSSNPYSDYTAKLAHEFLTKHNLRRAPGEKAEYSNFAVALLGNMLSQQAGETYDQLLQDRIAGPLGMTETHVNLTPAMRQRLAPPHNAGGAVSSTWEFADMPGAGGIRSSVKDMLRFAAANLSPPDDAVGKALNLAWKKHEDARPGELAMGLGWHFAQDGSTRWHNGETGGYHSMLMVNRALGGAVVILANSASKDVDQLAGQIIQLLAGAKVEPRKFEAAVKVAPDVMKRYEGQYQLAPGFVFTVKVQGDKLMVGVTNQPTLQVFPRSDTEWFYKVVEATLTFKSDGKGKFNELELFQNGVRQSAKRIK